MTTRWARFARGWIAALVSTFVAVFSHALAGGTPPGVTGLALCLAFAGLTCVALAGKTLSLPRLTLAVALSQFVFHSLFALLPDAAARPAVHHTGMMQSVTPFASTSAVMPHSGDLHMWAGHAVAAVITVMVLRHGERIFWGLAELASLVITRIVLALRPAAALPQPRPRALDHTLLPDGLPLHLSLHRHRGPPQPAFAA